MKKDWISLVLWLGQI